MEIWKSLWPVILFPLAPSFLLTLIAQNSGQRYLAFKELFFVFAAFSMLGMVTGYLSGFSREPALGAVLPAVLSLMGGLVVFLIGKNIESRVIVSASMLLFALTLLTGAEWGADMRDKSENYKNGEDYLKQRAFIESTVNEYRRNLDLPPITLPEK